ncbi:tRNA (guanine(9)-N1)-methyltransferase [Penicillium atrosanguineum]|uniref:tRNA (guanine(9)-N1)-methyltransferase n=1 Tax=Penicillium atrosanguineum TaxID=1132637 RepID=A0A9W9GG13_9EURO|nr:translation initiation factor eIF3 subunit [Penicillium atrosanguineum]KAJ5118736.1 tRNA (guanine(9)-N1)-methyltransferase [Penicillium atrosanguineum]KAJ5119775.1 tRNA (guanine(9)-N1)-methyltransferase [Penicillium atrosanguineum]KAJ5296775.1 translation initiation factor eIF3 subunit [Penicillium atrosanguineum]KAJ5299535.1 tRNA (guanine(9)-N1)-methyltransferase [Penicillium atrosanguineum]
MDEEERPMKMAKLGHDEPTPEELGPAMTGAVAVDKPQETEAAAADNSKPESTELPANNEAAANDSTAKTVTDDADAAPKMSKNALKKLRRKEKYEQERELRKERRREQMAAKKERRRKMCDDALATGGMEAVLALRKQWESTRSRHKRSTLIPFTIVVDCNYDDLMNFKERISLASQLTRCYSENSRAPWRGHLMFSSWGGLLKERFDTVLTPHKNWKGIKLVPENFVHAAKLATQQMASPRGGKLEGPFAKKADAKPEDGEVIYLSSDSDNTLHELRPYDTYIIGGLVDKNRYKAVCYKSALEAGVKTAKLPIGDYIKMSSRAVMTTNHVVDIMLAWLECGDWGEAFMKIMPQRKGGTLRNAKGDAGDTGAAEEDEQEEEEEDDEATLKRMNEQAEDEEVNEDEEKED